MTNQPRKLDLGKNLREPVLDSGLGIMMAIIQDLQTSIIPGIQIRAQSRILDTNNEVGKAIIPELEIIVAVAAIRTCKGAVTNAIPTSPSVDKRSIGIQTDNQNLLNHYLSPPGKKKLY